jgi:hypothetical protein
MTNPPRFTHSSTHFHNQPIHFTLTTRPKHVGVLIFLRVHHHTPSRMDTAAGVLVRRRPHRVKKFPDADQDLVHNKGISGKFSQATSQSNLLRPAFSW